MTTLSTRSISIRQVQQTVALTFHLTADDLVSSNRSQRVTCARHIAMYLSRELAGPPGRSRTPKRRRTSFPRIGLAFARDHTSVIHACHVIERRRLLDRGFSRLLDRLAGEVHLRAGLLPHTIREAA